MSLRSPLGLNKILEYGASLVKPMSKHANSSNESNYMDVMRDYLTNKITYQDAKRIFLQKYGNIQPVEQLKDILEEAKIETPIASPDPNTINPKKLRHWTQREDNRLLAGVFLFGLSDWNRIATFVGAGRGRPQCLQRWTRTLNPTITKDVWTEEEDQKLVSIVSQYEKVSWTKVANLMENRSDVQCRYHFSQLLKGKKTNLKIPDDPRWNSLNSSSEETKPFAQLAQPEQPQVMEINPSMGNGLIMFQQPIYQYVYPVQPIVSYTLEPMNVDAFLSRFIPAK